MFKQCFLGPPSSKWNLEKLRNEMKFLPCLLLKGRSGNCCQGCVVSSKLEWLSKESRRLLEQLEKVEGQQIVHTDGVSPGLQKKITQTSQGGGGSTSLNCFQRMRSLFWGIWVLGVASFLLVGWLQQREHPHKWQVISM